MDPSELVKVQLRDKRQCQNSERRGFESQEDTEGEQSKCNETSAIARCPPSLSDGIVRHIGR